jgi:pilus assembly protein Flp/PilA
MLKHVVRFMREEEGTTAVEYGLMIALISAALVTAVQLMGTNLTNRFNTVAGIVAS